MAADELGRAVDDDVDAVLNRLEQHRGHYGVVTDDRNRAVRCGVGRIGDGFEIGDVVLRVAQRFHVDQSRVFIDQAVNGFRFARIKETDFDAQVLQRLREQRPGAAIQRRAADDVLTAVGDRQNRSRDRRLAAGKTQARDATVQSRQTLFQNVDGWVHQPAVDVSELGQSEQRRSMFGVIERVTGRRIDRHRAAVGGGVGLLTGVQRQRRIAILRFGHIRSWVWRRWG